MTENTIQTVKINRIINDCKDVKTFVFHNPIKPMPKPGQFVMIWVPGVDEIPMSISACDETRNWAITVKNIGDCTQALHNLKINDDKNNYLKNNTNFKLIEFILNELLSIYSSEKSIFNLFGQKHY